MPQKKTPSLEIGDKKLMRSSKKSDLIGLSVIAWFYRFLPKSENRRQILTHRRKDGLYLDFNLQPV